MRDRTTTELHSVSRQVEEPSAHRAVRMILALIVLALVGGVGKAVLSLAPEAVGLSAEARRNLELSGVRNPATAVLLNYRAYDTLLELGVLMLAVLGARALIRESTAVSPGVEEKADPVLMGFLRLLAPVIVLTAGYLLWIGSYEPGGAFQAGAVLASAGVLMLLGRPHIGHRLSDRIERGCICCGFFVFLAVGAAVMAGDRRLLQYPPGHAGDIILAIEAAATLSIAAVLAALFAGGRIGLFKGDAP